MSLFVYFPAEVYAIEEENAPINSSQKMYLPLVAGSGTCTHSLSALNYSNAHRMCGIMNLYGTHRHTSLYRRTERERERERHR